MRWLLILWLTAGCRQLLDLDKPVLVDAGRDADTAPRDAAVDMTPAQLTEALLKEWSGCMSLANLTASGLANAWANLNSSNGECKSCHMAGQFGFIATANETTMFATLSENRYYMIQFFAVDLAMAKMVVNKANLDVVATAQPPHANHPTFPIANAGMTALDNFYNATVARKLAGMCDPPRLTN